MSDYSRVKKHYREVFDKLLYQNKSELNEISDYMKQKKLNKLVQLHILADIAEMVIDYQDRDVPIGELFGDDRDAFCDRLSENALLASPAEKIFKAVRDFSAVAMLVFLIITIESSASRYMQTLAEFAWGFLFWAVVFAVIFISATVGERYVAKLNYSLNCIVWKCKDSKSNK